MSQKSRFEEKYQQVESGCWEWTAKITNAGYGNFWLNGKNRGAHRVSYEMYLGPVGDKIVCHKCDNRKCVRPSHLFLGTVTDNNRDTSAKGRHVSHWKNLTHCKRGHEFTLVNTYLNSGRRFCKQCREIRRNEREKHAT